MLCIFLNLESLQTFRTLLVKCKSSDFHLTIKIEFSTCIAQEPFQKIVGGMYIRLRQIRKKVVTLIETVII